MLVHDSINQKNFIVSGVYGPAQSQYKEYFWDNLVQMNNVVDIP